jgi:glycerol-3-phosphate acyltransferase PlsX
MGGDHGCGVVIDGAILALKQNEKISELHLVGRREEIEAALAEREFHDPRLKLVHASEVLAMTDKAVEGLRRKKDCSILRAVELVKDGRAEALVSPGHTGGLVAASAIRLRTLPGVDRPGILTVIPAQKNEFILLDSGANIECRPIHLLHYAVMGAVYSREILGYKKPRVGILSNGTEENKGNALTLEAFKLCKAVELNFIGNVEGHDLFSDRVDVVVCDGFIGNIVLKTIESFAKGLFSWLKFELSSSPKRKIGAFLARNAFQKIKRRIDPDAYGGAPLLGLNGTIVKAHASARERAIMNAIGLAAGVVKNQVNQTIIEAVAAANERLAAAKLIPAPHE